MESRLEVATIEANCDPLNGYRLHWTVSRNQLEFVLQDIEVFSSPPFVATAQYQDKMLPVVNLEKHFGIPQKKSDRPFKYLVFRAANPEKGLVRLLIETTTAVKLQKVEQGLAVSVGTLALPKNTMDILGSYLLSPEELAIVPDIAGISRSLKLRGDCPL